MKGNNHSGRKRDPIELTPDAVCDLIAARAAALEKLARSSSDFGSKSDADEQKAAAKELRKLIDEVRHQFGYTP